MSLFIKGKQVADRDIVNVDVPLYKLNISHKNFKDILPTYPASKNQATLQVIHNRIANPIGKLVGHYDSLLVFGGDDVRHILNVSTGSSVVRIMSIDRDSNIIWLKTLATTDDIAELKQEIADLKSKIGGGTTQS